MIEEVKIRIVELLMRRASARLAWDLEARLDLDAGLRDLERQTGIKILSEGVAES